MRGHEARPDDRVGICLVPGGPEGYRAAVRKHTTTALSPEEIHQIGLDCLEALRAEWAEIGGRALGISDVPEILNRLREDRSLRFVLAGDGPEKAALVADAARRKLDGLTFLGPRAHAEMPALVASADIVIVCLKMPIPGAVLTNYTVVSARVQDAGEYTVQVCNDVACVTSQPADVPPVFLRREAYLIRGYSVNDRIVYGTGRIVAPTLLAETAHRTFRDPRVSYIHVRSASNNCYQCRIDPE